VFVSKNSQGELVFYESERKDRCWGFVNVDNDYVTLRDARRGQVFHHFKNAVAIQEEVLKVLERSKVRNVVVRVQNFEREDFWAVLPVKLFRALAFDEFGVAGTFRYDKKGIGRYGWQVRVPLNRFTRQYDLQAKLTAYTPTHPPVSIGGL
jgi:hypothetical protein